jgi:hypothetical protein
MSVIQIDVVFVGGVVRDISILADEVIAAVFIALESTMRS